MHEPLEIMVASSVSTLSRVPKQFWVRGTKECTHCHAPVHPDGQTAACTNVKYGCRLSVNIHLYWTNTVPMSRRCVRSTVYILNRSTGQILSG